MNGVAAVAAVAAATAVVARGGAPAAADADTPPAYLATRVAVPPVIDGRLDDEAWAPLPVEGRFTQEVPREGAAPTERTELRIGFDDDAVYVGVLLLDGEPSRVRARLTRRDRDVEADSIKVSIDSRGDREGAFVFALNAAGVQSDGILYDDTTYSAEWDAVWDGAAARHERGWSAELRIPLSALRFSSAPQRPWGLQVERYIARKKERVAWRFTPSDVRGEATRMGVLEGMDRLRPGRVIELRPFGVARLSDDHPRGFAGATDGARALDPGGALGLDAKVPITSDLVLDATINPDFGQLEADQLVLNLSRFETLFPEKRVFFLEGLDVMASPLQLFYSRRIGDTLLGAAKLAGKVSRRTAVAALVAVTGAEEIEADDGGTMRAMPPRLWGIARARITGGGATYVGVHATAVRRLGGHALDAELDHDALSQGIDGQWQSSGGAWRVAGQVVASQRIGGAPVTRDDGTRLSGDDAGVGGRATLERFLGGWLARLEWESLSPRLDLNGVGFQTNFGVHHGTLTLGRSDTGDLGPFQRYAAEVKLDTYDGFDGLATWRALEGTAEAETWSFWRLQLGAGVLATGTWDRYETSGDGGRIQRPGSLFGSAGVVSDPRRAIAAEVTGSLYRDLDRPSHGGAATLRLAARPGTRAELDAIVTGGVDRRVLRFYACSDPDAAPCTVDTEVRDYTFAELDAASLSVTARASLALSTRLSIQGGGQLFLARGAYHDFAAASTGPGPRMRFDHFAPAPGRGDADGDGAPDGNFAEATVNADVHLRWERTPGSVVFLGYARHQAASPAASAAPSLDPGLLSAADVDERIYFKWVHYLAL